MWSRFHLDATKFIALGIAIALWALVRGQGIGSLSIDVPLQVQGLAPQLMIVNNLPEHVRITVSGPQTRLAKLDAQDIRVSLDAATVKKPGVEEIALVVDDIKIPAALKVERVQPDRIFLQIDRIIERKIKIFPRLELPDGWVARQVEVKPASILLKGPEVWLDALSDVKTSAIHPDAKVGKFTANTGIESPTGKAIHLVNPGVKITVRGLLSSKSGFSKPEKRSISPDTTSKKKKKPAKAVSREGK